MSGANLIGLQGVKDISETPMFKIGTRLELKDGREFVYSKAGGTALATGKVMQAEGPNADVTNVAVAASAVVGATTVVIDSAGAIVANEYAEGYLIINDATGQGQMPMKIKSHGALAGAGELTLNLYTSSPLTAAITVDVSEASLIKSPYNSVIICPTTLTAKVVGITNTAVTASYYFWLQVSGVANVLINGTPGVGVTVVNSGTTAGAVDVVSATNLVTDQIVGAMLVAGVSTEYRALELSL